MRHFYLIGMLACLTLFVFELAVASVVKVDSRSIVGLPAPPIYREVETAQTKELKGKIQRAKIFSAYDSLIKIYKTQGLYDKAAALEREQVLLYRAKKLNDAAIIHQQNAQTLETRISTYADQQLSAKAIGKLYTGAPNEPFIGCYNGAFIDRDDSLGTTWTDANWQKHRSPAQFKKATGKQPGSAFTYLSYRRPFPKQWVEQLKSTGVIPHIAWEPKSLSAVQDDEFLKQFALDLREADWPVFLRFASEMNGKWTPYHGNPTLYKQKFQLVYRTIHRYAPRAALIWCVNNPPLGNAHDYYPGDNFVDWVGVNFYSVPFADNRRDRQVKDQNPLALLDPIYNRYSAKKPIAICEFAASHKSILDPQIIDKFAIEKLNLVYSALPLLYPRVKMINWFSMDTIKYPTPGKTRNNYDLTDHPRVLRAWQRVTDQPHFLNSWQRLGDKLPPVAQPLAGKKVKIGDKIRIFARSYDPNSKVIAAIDNKIVFRGQGSGAFEFVLKGSTGSKRVQVFVYDSKNRFQKQSNTTFYAV
jgi:hypothetical protein